jgi:hypothetical protein
MKMLIDEDGKNNTGNLLLLSPDQPSDENLAILLQAKMNALAAGRLLFGAVEIKSNNLSGLRFTFIGSAKEALPDMGTWMGTNNYFEQPWWERDDSSTLDVVPPPDANLEEKPTWAYSLDFIEKAIKPKQDRDSVIVRPDFNPTIIDGGKKDE